MLCNARRQPASAAESRTSEHMHMLARFCRDHSWAIFAHGCGWAELKLPEQGLELARAGASEPSAVNRTQIRQNTKGTHAPKADGLTEQRTPTLPPLVAGWRCPR